ncbi:MAG: septum formation initiator family protein [Syntrophales bacterium]|nr:septum formation initiator family protein [Syntrophales bacterium]PKN03879.1 MAG: cell division protein FtsB [Deltaproteobacteria bacterium HGW-Deltaproteobacteria-9]
MKVGRYLAGFVLVMGFLIAFGNRGLVDNYMMHERLAALKKANQDIARENKDLRKTIVLLRSKLPYVEMVARNELGMVKKGDLVYRFSQ